jgi:uncharacterized protein HemX
MADAVFYRAVVGSVAVTAIGAGIAGHGVQQQAQQEAERIAADKQLMQNDEKAAGGRAASSSASAAQSNAGNSTSQQTTQGRTRIKREGQGLADSANGKR